MILPWTPCHAEWLVKNSVCKGQGIKDGVFLVHEDCSCVLRNYTALSHHPNVTQSSSRSVLLTASLINSCCSWEQNEPWSVVRQHLHMWGPRWYISRKTLFEYKQSMTLEKDLSRVALSAPRWQTMQPPTKANGWRCVSSVCHSCKWQKRCSPLGWLKSEMVFFVAAFFTFFTHKKKQQIFAIQTLERGKFSIFV